MDTSDRFIFLDALRGMAALTVFFSHAIGMLPTYGAFISSIENTPLHIFYDGAAAVDMFFVLSGFCISYPYLKENSLINITFWKFMGKRIFRIYPAYWVSIGFCLLGWGIYSCPELAYISQWGASFWRQNTFSIREIEDIFLLIFRSFDTNLLNPPSWSLVIEIRMAFILPFLYFFQIYESKNMFFYNSCCCYLYNFYRQIWMGINTIFTTFFNRTCFSKKEKRI